jgi:hypothetical protein
MEHHKMPYSGKFQHSVLGINKILCTTSQLYHYLGTAPTSVIGHSAPPHYVSNVSTNGATEITGVNEIQSPSM